MYENRGKFNYLFICLWRVQSTMSHFPLMYQGTPQQLESSKNPNVFLSHSRIEQSCAIVSCFCPPVFIKLQMGHFYFGQYYCVNYFLLYIFFYHLFFFVLSTVNWTSSASTGSWYFCRQELCRGLVVYHGIGLCRSCSHSLIYLSHCAFPL